MICCQNIIAKRKIIRIEDRWTTGKSGAPSLRLLAQVLSSWSWLHKVLHITSGPLTAKDAAHPDGCLPQPVAQASGIATVVHSVQPESRTLIHSVECRQVQGTDRRHAGVGSHCEDDDHLVPGCLPLHNTKELSLVERAYSVLP